MAPSLRRYLAIEMTVAAVVSAVLSVAFVFLVFGGQATVPVGGAGGLIVDALPQSAMIALMSCLVPTFLAHRRVRSGTIPPRAGRVWRPHHAVARAVIVAVVVAAAAGMAHSALMPIGPPRWSFAASLAFKMLYGAGLGALVARWAVIAALADPAVRDPAGNAAATARRDA